MADVNQNRLIRLFQSLVAIDTESFHERQMNDYLQKIWKERGVILTEDDAGEKIGGNAGNLFGVWKSDDPTAVAQYDSGGKIMDSTTILFCGHQDTVKPGIGKKAIVHEDGTITSDGTTVLGADDAAALAIIYEAVHELQEEKAPHNNIELLFPVAEEPYTAGSSVFDFAPVHAKVGYCLDCSDRLGSYSAQEPTLISFRFHVHGRAAHAGFEPEAGINALAAAAAAVARIPQGRPDDHSTFNFGMIKGGTNTNSVPEDVWIDGELRSAVHEDALKLYDRAAAVFREEAEKIGASFEEKKEIKLYAYQITEDNPALVPYLAALKKFGIEPYAKPNFGGSDCNVLIRNGIQAICTFNSMHNCHTTREYATVDEMVQMTRIVKELMRA